MYESSWWSCWCTHNARCVVCFVLVLLAFIFDVVGFAVPYWYYYTIGNIKYYGGLWRWCTNTAGVVICEKAIVANDEGM